MTDQTEKQLVKLAKRARATAAKKYGDAMRRGYLTQTVYDQLELAEAALLINQQAGAKYAAASELIGEVVNQQWNEACDKAIASSNP